VTGRHLYPKHDYTAVVGGGAHGRGPGTEAGPSSQKF